MTIKRVKPDSKGRIVLEPYTETPFCEKWLFNNKSAINQVKRGLKNFAEGRFSKRGSFTKYLDEEHK